MESTRSWTAEARRGHDHNVATIRQLHEAYKTRLQRSLYLRMSDAAATTGLRVWKSGNDWGSYFHDERVGNELHRYEK